MPHGCIESRIAVIFLIALFIIFNVCCQQLQRTDLTKAETVVAGKAIDPVALRSDVRTFLEEMRAEVMGTASTVAAGSTDPRVRENTLLMKIRVSNAYESIALEVDPRRAFLLSWAGIAQAQVYQRGRGKETFGGQEPLILAMLDRLEHRIIEIGREHFGDEEIEEAKDDVAKQAARGPFMAQYLTDGVSLTLLEESPKQADLLDLLDMPLAPVRGLQGIGSTPDAVNRLSTVASGLMRVVRDLPERTRWQTELLLLEIEDRETVVALRQAANAVDKNTSTFVEQSQQIVDLAKTLPDRLEEKVNAMIDRIDAKQAGLRGTVAEARGAVTDANQAIRDARPLAESIERTAQGFTAAGSAWEKTFAELNRTLKQFEMDPNAPPDPDARPFDIQDYEKTVNGISTAAVELQNLVQDVRDLTDGESLSNVNASANKTIDYTASRAIDLTDHIILRLGQLIAFILVASLLHRFVSAKITPRKPKMSA